MALPKDLYIFSVVQQTTKKFYGLCLMIVLSLLILSCERQTKPATQTQTPPHILYYDTSLGPFKIGAKRFTVILHRAKRNDSSTDTVETFDIVDEAKNIHIHRIVCALSPDHADFDSSEIKAFKLQGTENNALLLWESSHPNAPGWGEYYEVFFIDPNNKLVSLGTQMGFHGSDLDLPRGTRDNELLLFPGDILKFRIQNDESNYFFSLLIPMKIDFKNLTFLPEKTSGMFEIIPNIAKNPMIYEAVLFMDRKKEAPKKTVAVSSKDQIIFLGAYADIVLTHEKGIRSQTLLVKNVWLKVKIDGVEGWLYDDFGAVGLHSAG